MLIFSFVFVICLHVLSSLVGEVMLLIRFNKLIFLIMVCFSLLSFGLGLLQHLNHLLLSSECSDMNSRIDARGMVN